MDNILTGLLSMSYTWYIYIYIYIYAHHALREGSTIGCGFAGHISSINRCVYINGPLAS